MKETRRDANGATYIESMGCYAEYGNNVNFGDDVQMYKARHCFFTGKIIFNVQVLCILYPKKLNMSIQESIKKL